MATQGAALAVGNNAAGFEKLVRCTTVGLSGEQGVRFVPLEYFSLWEHMMRSRHGITCRDHSVALWIPADEFERHAHVYSHSGTVEPVGQLNFSIFDDNLHYTYSASRYVPDADAERFREAMLAHIPESIRSSSRFDLKTIPGYCVEKKAGNQRNDLVLGLYHDLQDVY